MKTLVIEQSPYCETWVMLNAETSDMWIRAMKVPADLIIKAGLIAEADVSQVKLPQPGQRISAVKVLSKKC